jgi:hypothetical protein
MRLLLCLRSAALAFSTGRDEQYGSTLALAAAGDARAQRLTDDLARRFPDATIVQRSYLHAGGTVFIPAYTWVSVKNAGTETVSVVFVFSAPGFENYMRFDSVLANEKVTPLSLEEQKECAHEGHVIYKELEENPKR